MRIGAQRGEHRLWVFFLHTVDRKDGANSRQNDNPESVSATLDSGFCASPRMRGIKQFMNLAQSPHVPESAKRPRLRDLPWMLAYFFRAFGELARARVTFAKLQARAIPERNHKARTKAAKEGRIPEKVLARIAFVVPRLSDRLPWRSDCVIQAIAAQNWLSSYGVYGEIQIGVENPTDGEFGAHAWLMHCDSVVTGGDISRYAPILTDSVREN